MIEQERVETFFRQASMTAATYFHEAIEKIDGRFGDGYAESHPELIGQFMQTAAIDFASCLLSEVVDRLSDNLDNLPERL